MSEVGEASGGSIFGGLILGVLMIPAACILLWWNEGRAVERYKALAEGAAKVVTADPDSIDPAQDGKLVHVVGPTSVEKAAQDTVFGIQGEHLRLFRKVEMYQWVEEKKSKSSSSGGSKYRYHLRWRENLVDSSRFRESAAHQNPTSMPYKSQSFTAQGVRLGKRHLDAIADRITGAQALHLHELPSQAQSQGYILQDRALLKSSAPQSSPQLGDIRVSFRHVPMGQLSCIAQQDKEHLVSAQASNGSDITLFAVGRVNAEAMFAKAETDNLIVTWALRGTGLVVMFIGFAALFSPLQLLVSFVPVLNVIVDAGLSLLSGVLAFCLSLLVISVAWFYYRPVLSISLLVVAGALLSLLFIRRKRRLA